MLVLQQYGAGPNKQVHGTTILIIRPTSTTFFWKWDKTHKSWLLLTLGHFHAPAPHSLSCAVLSCITVGASPKVLQEGRMRKNKWLILLIENWGGGMIAITSWISFRNSDRQRWVGREVPCYSKGRDAVPILLDHSVITTLISLHL